MSSKNPNQDIEQIVNEINLHSAKYMYKRVKTYGDTSAATGWLLVFIVVVWILAVCIIYFSH